VVIDEAHEDRIAAAVRQVGLRRGAEDYRHVRQRLVGDELRDLRNPFAGHVGRVDPAGRSDLSGHHRHERAGSGADVGHDRSGTDLEHFDQLRRVGRIPLGLAGGGDGEDAGGDRAGQAASASESRHG
jgi:hypothetical protein